MANLSKYNRGSEWRKWDLHFHTPSSYDYENDSITNQDIIDCLLSSEIDVVTITDHHYIDVNRINELRKLSEERLIILPGIELRSELGDKPIHYIGIFSERINLEHLWDTIKGTFGLTPEGIEKMGGDDRVYIPISKASNIFRELGGLISIHAGAKSNSIEGIENKEQFQQRIKYDITKDFVGILEIGQLKDINRYMNIVFPATGLERPLIIGSDNHNITDYKTSLPCWLKADPTFTGLRQVLNEPVERVHLGNRPRIFGQIENNKTRYIQSISFSKRSDSKLDEQWYSAVSLQFNSGLIAIIGNKGAGKSALADVFGLLGNCPHEKSFSFLHEDQFRHPRENKAQHFDATLTWRSGDSKRLNLDDRYDSSLVESIRYIPQFHLDAICDELKGGREGKFNEELKQVIFSRVSLEEQLGKDTLDELINFKTLEIQESIRLITEELRKTTTEIVHLEEQSTLSYSDNLKSEIKAIEDEIKAHKTIKPAEINKPDADSEKQKEIEEITDKIEELSIQIKTFDEQIAQYSEKLKEIILKLELIVKLRRKINNFKTQYDTLISDIAEDCRKLNVVASDLVNIDINISVIDKLEETLKSSKTEIEDILGEDDDKSLINRKKKIKKEIQSLREKLDRPNKEYQTYLKQKSKWEQKLNSLIGNTNTPGTLEYFKVRLSDLEQVPAKLKLARKKQLEQTGRIYHEKKKQMSIFENLYKPVQEFIDNHPLAHERFGLEFSVSLLPKDFVDRFLNFINQGKKGSFYGDEGREALNRLLDLADFETEDTTLKFVNLLNDYLHFDYRDDKKEPLLVSKQLRKGFLSSQLYEYLYCLEYLEPRYELKWEGKRLEQLSPGERGALLLIFYLLIDNSNIPLVMDQPEGNLDNQTVFQLLVDCVKESKKRRQIFIVTHNPNLAVVCDAEQVIHAKLNKEENCQLSYTSGSLENPEICKAIVDVLEGTKPAIDNRVSKYRIVFDNNKI